MKYTSPPLKKHYYILNKASFLKIKILLAHPSLLLILKKSLAFPSVKLEIRTMGMTRVNNEQQQQKKPWKNDYFWVKEKINYLHSMKVTEFYHLTHFWTKKLFQGV